MTSAASDTAPGHARRSRWLPHPVAAKVPEITVLFWLVKVLTTGVGEAASDFLAARSIPLAAAVGLVGFVAAMAVQLRARRYRPWAYWFAVSMVAVFGTMAADGLHVVVGIPYPVTTAGYLVALAVIFLVWRRTEGTLSIHSVTSRRREAFYWLTVLATFALGTAAGDFTAFSLGLGYLASIAVFGVAILLPLVAWRWFRLDAVAAFWIAYVLTRPLGASVADWFGKPSAKGGLGWGDGTVTLVGVVLIAAGVAYLARSGHGVQPARDEVAPAALAAED
ncbi:MAG: hypothetical protein FWF90_05790 [Promicromonosporaceae bacterium]|nr:hypothetical protein [Promicromonosporaceae bacterium]